MNGPRFDADQLDQLFTYLYAFRQTAAILQRHRFDPLPEELNLKELETALDYSPDLIKHVKSDYELWIDPKKPKQLPPSIYLHSLAQRQRLLEFWWEQFFAKCFGHREIIFDFGGGLGYLASLILKIRDDAIVRLYDRPDMIVVANDYWKGALSRLSFHTCNLLNPIHMDPPIKASCVLLSEVVHGKSHNEAVQILKGAKRCLNDDGRGRVMIIELKAGTPLSRLFSLQMAIRTPHGKLYTPLELVHMLTDAGFNNIRSLGATPYHEAFIGTP